MISVTQPNGETVSYTYDSHGNRATMTYPNGKTVKYTYDDMNRLIAVKGIDGETTKYEYDALGRRISTDGAKEDTTYAYDEVGNLTSQATTGAYDLALEYAYDLSGRMTQESRTENGATLTSSFTYDALGQLTSFTRSDGQSESYAYDPVGNMTAKMQNGVSTTMRYNAANQLISSVTGGETTKYSYDANGNLTRSENAAGARSYAYNALNLLQSFTREDGYTETYSYNANRLLSEIRTSEDLTTTLTWDILYGDGVVISENQNGQTTSYTYGLERISALTGKTRSEYVYDGRGSVAAEVSYNNAWYTFGGGLAKKTVTAKSYTPFGEQIGETVSGFGYNGEYYNVATGMIYLRARFYEPEMNRFSQKDTLRGSIADPVGLNRYLYCQSDPVNFADYNGLQMVNVCVADGGGSGRRVTPNQTTSIVTKPGQNSVSSANTASRMVAVPVTDTGTGGYSSAYSAAGAVAGYGNGRDNQGTQTGTSQTSGITQASPSVQAPVVEGKACSSRSFEPIFSSGVAASWEVILAFPDLIEKTAKSSKDFWVSFAQSELASGRAGEHVQRALEYATGDAAVASRAGFLSHISTGIGALVDFGLQVYHGEEIGHAAIKRVAHVGIGLLAGAAATLIFTNPVLAIGASVLGAVVASNYFDSAYDSHLRDPVENIWNSIIG